MFFLAFPSFKFSYFPAYNFLSYLLNFYVYLRYLLSSFKLIRFPANYFLLFFSTFRFICPVVKNVRSYVFHFQVLSLLCSTYRFIWFPSDYVLSSFLHLHLLVSFFQRCSFFHVTVRPSAVECITIWIKEFTH
jgi:hypothetical protein